MRGVNLNPLALLGASFIFCVTCMLMHTSTFPRVILISSHFSRHSSVFWSKKKNELPTEARCHVASFLWRRNRLGGQLPGWNQSLSLTTWQESNAANALGELIREPCAPDDMTYLPTLIATLQKNQLHCSVKPKCASSLAPTFMVMFLDNNR